MAVLVIMLDMGIHSSEACRVLLWYQWAVSGTVQLSPVQRQWLLDKPGRRPLALYPP